MKKILFTLLTPFLLQTNSFALALGERGSWGNEVKASGSLSTNYEDQNTLAYDLVDILSDPRQRRNQFSPKMTSEALVDLGQNLYGFLLDLESGNGALKVADLNGDGVLNDGDFGTPYDCTNYREIIGNRFCNFIDMLEYNKQKGTGIQIVLIHPPFVPTGTSYSSRWMNWGDIDGDGDYDNDDIYDYTLYSKDERYREWGIALTQLAQDMVELGKVYPNLKGFTVDDFGVKTCSPTTAPPGRFLVGKEECLTYWEVQSIFDNSNIASGGATNFYPLIYSKRSNFLIHDAIILGTNYYSTMKAHEELTVEVPVDIKIERFRFGRGWVPWNSVTCSTLSLDGITSDTYTGTTDVNAKNLTKLITLEDQFGLYQKMYHSTFADTESYNDLLSTYTDKLSNIQLSHESKLNLHFNIKALKGLLVSGTPTPQKELFWSISNLSLNCTVPMGPLYRVKLTPRIEKGVGQFYSPTIGFNVAMGDSRLNSTQKKLIAGNTKSYSYTTTPGWFNNEYNFPKLMETFNWVYEVWNYNANNTQSWTSVSDYDLYFDNLYNYYLNKSKDFITQLNGLDTWVNSINTSIQEKTIDVIDKYDGHFWFYKGGLGIHFDYLSDIGAFSHTDGRQYNNTLFIAEDNTKYPYTYLKYRYNLKAGYEHILYLVDYINDGEFVPKVYVDGILQAIPYNYSSGTSGQEIEWNIDLTGATADQTIEIYLEEVYTTSGKQETSNRSVTHTVFFEIFDGFEDDFVTLDSTNFESGFNDPVIMSVYNSIMSKF